MFIDHVKKLAGKPAKKRPYRSPRCNPGIEHLEDRTVPSFFTSPTFAVGLSPHGEAVGDFNGDGKADLVVVNQGANTMSVLLGNGEGTFQPRTDIALPPTPVTLIPVVPLAVTVGDFNGDGKADLALATQISNTDDMTLLLGNGNGTFQASVTTVTNGSTFAGFGLSGNCLLYTSPSPRDRG